jgi:hypothetical protein
MMGGGQGANAMLYDGMGEERREDGAPGQAVQQ